MKSVKIFWPKKVVKGSVNLPLSKSHCNRILMLQAVSDGKIKASAVSDARDTIILQKDLNHVAQHIGSSDPVLVRGEDAGTVVRFLLAYLCIKPGNWILDGTERMRERPMAPLVDALKSLGAEIKYMGKEGVLPLQIKGKKLEGGEVTIDTSLSSQFLSALLLIGATLKKGIRIKTTGKYSSRPYIDMTIQVLKEAGLEVYEYESEFYVPGQTFKAKALEPESDWSSASYLYGLCALSEDGNIKLPGLNLPSTQGDAVLSTWMENYGVRTYITGKKGVDISRFGVLNLSGTFNFLSQPDLAPAIIVLTACLKQQLVFHGLASLRLKESDRTSVLARELAKFNVQFREMDLGTWAIDARNFTWKPGIEIDPENDHRIAMAFSLLSMVGESVTIRDAECVEKSFPDFWNQIQAAGARAEWL